MEGMTSLQLESEIAKTTRAMMTRNSEIGQDIISYLKAQMTVEAVAGLMIVSIERLIWFDVDSVFWAMEYLIPADVMLEIRRILTVDIYKRLIAKGFMPGRDLSVDAEGKLLLSHQAKAAIAPCGAKREKE